MKYLSSKQAAEKWNISPRRVVFLASSGKIDGAILMDNRWLIPDDSEKPVDSRYKKNKEQDDRYIFPYIISCIHSEEQVKKFTPEEYRLYELDLEFEAGNFTNAKKLAEDLIYSSNEYIKLGALYILSILSMYLNDFVKAGEYSLLFNLACNNINEHKDEVSLLRKELSSELSSMTEFINDLDSINIDAFSDEHLPMVSTYLIISDIMQMASTGKKFDIIPAEITLRNIEKDGYFYYSMLIHCYLSSYYAIIQNKEKEYSHMKQAIDIGLKHNTVFTLAYTILYNINTANLVLSEYPKEVAIRFNKLNEIFLNARSAYAKYLGNNTALPKLTNNDIALIYCIIKNLNIRNMAKELNLSESTLKKRLSVLYKKMDVKNKKELLENYIPLVLDIVNREK